MLFGTASFAETPISSLTTDGNVTVVAQKNRLTVSIGPISIAATAITEDPDPTKLTLGTGTVTLSGTANVTGLKLPLVLGTGNVTVSGTANVASVGNALTIKTGTVTITGTANVTNLKVPLTLATGNAGVITWNEIIPGATMVWTPIKPY
tara:strand:- start:308 stop:757 length:450 start_codon:yes stop_codon:yes gene_type:complete